MNVNSVSCSHPDQTMPRAHSLNERIDHMEHWIGSWVAKGYLTADQATQFRASLDAAKSSLRSMRESNAGPLTADQRHELVASLNDIASQLVDLRRAATGNDDGDGNGGDVPPPVS